MTVADDHAFALDFIARARWTTAKDDGGGRWPHQYAIREQWVANAGSPDEWDRMMQLVVTYGRREDFFRKVQSYLHMGEVKYFGWGRILNRVAADNLNGPQQEREQTQLVLDWEAHHRRTG